MSAIKDVEGLGHKFVYNVYHNIRFMNETETMKSIIPCTPLACVKVCIFSKKRYWFAVKGVKKRVFKHGVCTYRSLNTLVSITLLFLMETVFMDVPLLL